MDHTPQSVYARLRDTHPRWFLSPPGEGSIGIMRWPMAEGQALHHDEERMVLEDPVVLPDGRHARRLRLLGAQPEPPVAVLPLLDGDVVLIDAVGNLARNDGIRRVRTVAFAVSERMALTGQITDAVTITALFRARWAGVSR
ncbi:hypothetical protein [Streptomyces sp. NPDC015350]|uniref:hypothetical protein n=1 Tax=Streptomyces sp. NPDC015350 TaxID=3364955 RepID=UPI0036F9C6C4